MKKLLCISALFILLDQAAKHLARHFFEGRVVEVVPRVLGIKPFHNTYLGWLGWWVGPVSEPSPVILVVFLHIFFTVLLVMGYKYLCFAAVKNRTLLNAFFTTALAGVGSAFIDNMLFNGTWDFIYILGWWIIDLKDIYLLTSIVLINIFGIIFIPKYFKLNTKQRKQLGLLAWLALRKSELL